MPGKVDRFRLQSLSGYWVYKLWSLVANDCSLNHITKSWEFPESAQLDSKSNLLGVNTRYICIAAALACRLKYTFLGERTPVLGCKFDLKPLRRKKT